MKPDVFTYDPTETLGEITVTVEPSARFKLRLRLGLWLMRLGARVAYLDLSVRDGTVQCEGCRVTMDEDDALSDCDGVPLCAPCMKELARDCPVCGLREGVKKYGGLCLECWRSFADEKKTA